MNSSGQPIILVHGAWSRGSTWDSVKANLRKLGYDVFAPDLPGHGDDKTPPEDVGLDDYAKPIADLLNRVGPALLVGHSMGGMVISAAAELAPEKASKLVYVTAFLPKDGQSLLDLIRRQDSPGIRDAILPGNVAGITLLDPDKAMNVLCQDATQPQRMLASAGLGPQPNRGQTDRIHLTPERFDRIPKAYIHCDRDLTILPELQHAMVAESGCDEKFNLDCGHLPQLTRPDELANLITRLGGAP